MHSTQGHWYKLSRIYSFTCIVILGRVSSLRHQLIRQFLTESLILTFVAILAALLAISITLITVGFRAVRAAGANPVSSLRAE